MARQETLLYPLPNQEIDPRFAAHLILLVEDQKQALQDGEFVPKSTNSFKELRNWFKRSERFKQIFSETLKFLVVPRTDEEIEEFKKYFRGQSFQYIASRFLAGKQPQDRILLSPERTLTFYNSLHPHTPRSSNPLGLDSLEGISAPDGIIIEKSGDKNRILAICEYTLARRDSYFENKYNAFVAEKRRFPQLFAHAPLFFVSPRINYRLEIVKQAKARLIKMPFEHKKFKNFIDEIFEHYRPEGNNDYASLAEIQESVRERLEKEISGDRMPI